LVAQTPARSEDLNSLAWWLVVKPASAQDARIAVTLAEHAVKLDATAPTYHNTLGVAYCRAGRFAEAIGALQTSLKEARGQTDAFDLYFLAMCHQALGDPAKARADFDRAVAWRKQPRRLSPEWVAELDAFHAEAAALLGVTEQAPR
jgi:uncharacterized protein HemY